MQEIKRILVVSRMTKYCNSAVHAGILLARHNDATLCVYHSTYAPFEAEDWFCSLSSMKETESEYRDVQEEVRDELNAIIAKEHAIGVNIEVIVSKEDPDNEILRIVKEKSIDLIVLRAHKEGLIEHFFYGGSTDKIVRMMPCSVMLVKDERLNETTTA